MAASADDRYSDQISFHKFPKDKNLRKQWLIKIRRDEGPFFQITDSTVVCSKHFKTEDFKWTPVKKTLKKGSIPTVFNWIENRTPRRALERKQLAPKTKDSAVDAVTDTSNITEMELITVALEDMLNNYDKRIRPGYGGGPVDVQLNINIRSLGPISEMDMAFTMDCYFRQVWTDPRLAMWNSDSNQTRSDEFIQLSIKILERIWYPDTVFYNGMKSYLHTITTPNRFIRIYRDGKILFSQRLTVRAMCKMELRKYPLDEQNCPLHIGSFAYSTKDVTYLWRHENPVEMPKDMRLSQFDLLETPFNYTSVNFFKGAWHTVLSVDFRLSRHLGYFLINVYVPCCLLVILSWVAFWINREATADRIALGTMTVLTMTFLGLESRSDLPRVSYTTALDIYIAMAFVFVLATMVQFAAVHNYTKHGYGEPLPPPPEGHGTEDDDDEEHEKLLPRRRGGTRTARLKRQRAQRGHTHANGGHHFSRASMKRAASKVWKRLTRLSNKKSPVEQSNSVSKIDRASRILFPLAFLAFNIVYCLVYYST